MERQERLQVARQHMISALQSSVFPVEVEPLSVDDAGEEGEISHVHPPSVSCSPSPQTTWSPQ